MNKHPFLSNTVCVHRLVEEHKQYGSIAVAYDFDNCVYDYHSKSHDYSEVIDILKQAKEVGCYLTVFTAEDDLSKVKSFLDENEIPYDAINENPPFFKKTSRKIYYSLLLDDRAGLRSAYIQLKQFIHIIKNKI